MEENLEEIAKTQQNEPENKHPPQDAPVKDRTDFYERLFRMPDVYGWIG
ncbi:MAG: hypothetical protein HY363_00375 [Candidatus Aenigmarchaeota archaeon]|nr:hypothetical protein [Candidatus Aenigmarchaeota archaeon]